MTFGDPKESYTWLSRDVSSILKTKNQADTCTYTNRSTDINTHLHITHRTFLFLVTHMSAFVGTRSGTLSHSKMLGLSSSVSIFLHKVKDSSIQLQVYWVHKSVCVCVWTHCCLTDSWGNYRSTVAVTPTQPFRLSPRTPALLNPSRLMPKRTLPLLKIYLLNDRGRRDGRRKREKINKRQKAHKLADTELTDLREKKWSKEKRGDEDDQEEKLFRPV